MEKYTIRWHTHRTLHEVMLNYHDEKSWTLYAIFVETDLLRSAISIFLTDVKARKADFPSKEQDKIEKLEEWDKNLPSISKKYVLCYIGQTHSYLGRRLVHRETVLIYLLFFLNLLPNTIQVVKGKIMGDFSEEEMKNVYQTVESYLIWCNSADFALMQRANTKNPTKSDLLLTFQDDTHHKHLINGLIKHHP